MNEKDKNEILEGVDETTRLLVEPLLEEAIFVFERIKNIKELPFILYNKSNKGDQKATPAAKQYKELMSTYTSLTRNISAMLNIKDETGDTSRIDKFFSEFYSED